MRELLPTIENWISEGKKVALATVVEVYGSAPQPLGSKMVISSNGEMAGSVSAGCVEAAVVEEALACLKENKSKLLHFGVANETAWEVGLTCGGTLEVFVEPLTIDAHFSALRDALLNQRMVAAVTMLTGEHTGKKMLLTPQGEALGSLGAINLNDQALEQIKNIWQTHASERTTTTLNGIDNQIFYDVFPPLPRLIIVGAVHIAMPLVDIAKTLGFHTIVIDARGAFATPERFPHVDQLIKQWPQDALKDLKLDESSYVVTLTHDEKFDNPALKVALNSPARYIGALGSKKTHAKRCEALLQEGVTQAQLERIHAPIGLKIGSRGPKEIALSIMAEIIAVSHGL